jgi:hypothetical protein
MRRLSDQLKQLRPLLADNFDTPTRFRQSPVDRPDLLYVLGVPAGEVKLAPYVRITGAQDYGEGQGGRACSVLNE